VLIYKIVLWKGNKKGNRKHVNNSKVLGRWHSSLNITLMAYSAMSGNLLCSKQNNYQCMIKDKYVLCSSLYRWHNLSPYVFKLRLVFIRHLHWQIFSLFCWFVCLLQFQRMLSKCPYKFIICFQKLLFF